MQPSFVIAAIPVVVKAIVLIVACLAGGFFAGFFLFRLRFKKELGLYEARETALKNREEEVERIRASLRSNQEIAGTSNPEATIKMLREDLEQGSIELSIAKQEFDLELTVLREEIESLKSSDTNSGRYPVEIVDVEFESTESSDLPEEPGEVEDDALPEPATGDAGGHKERMSSEKVVEEETEGELEELAEESEEQPRRTAEPIEDTESAGDWATSVITYLLGDFLSPSSDEDEKSSVLDESELPEEEPLTETVLETSSEFALETVPYPKFCSLAEFVSLDDLTNGNGIAIETNPESINSNAEEAGLQVLLDLTDLQFRRLRELGFASYEKIAELSSPDIRRLTEEFQISSERIEQIWISSAQLRLYEGD